MPARNDALRSRLSESSELNITVTGRRSGCKISLPIRFVLEGDKLYLLPVKDSDSCSNEGQRQVPLDADKSIGCAHSAPPKESVIAEVDASRT